MLLAYSLFCLGVITGVSLIIIGLSKPGENSLTRFAERLHKKYFSAVVLIFVLVLVTSVAAWAGEYFSPIEKGKICPTIAKVLPGVKVQYSNTCTSGGGILIGPLQGDKILFIYAKASGEVFIYKPPVEYHTAAVKIAGVVCQVIENRPASVALGRKLIQ